MAIASTSSPLTTTSRSDGASPGSATSRRNNTRTYGRRGVAAAAAATAASAAAAASAKTATTATMRGSTSATPSYAGEHHKRTPLHLDDSSSSSSGSGTEQGERIEKQLGLRHDSSSSMTTRVDKGKGTQQATQPASSSPTVVNTLMSKRSLSALRGKGGLGIASTSSDKPDSGAREEVLSRALPRSGLPSRQAPAPAPPTPSASTPKPVLNAKLKHKVQESEDDDDVQEPPSPPPRKKRPLPSTSTPPVLASTTNKPTLTKATPLTAGTRSTLTKTKTPSVSPTKKRKTSQAEHKETTKARPSTPPPSVPSHTPSHLSRPSTPKTSRSIAASNVASTSAAPIAPVASPLRSPAKDLSDIFDSFNSASASDSERSAILKEIPSNSPSKSPPKDSAPSGSVVAGMAPRRRGFSPGLMRQGSLTPTSSRTIHALSPRPLGPSHSQPTLSPTRPISRPGSPSRHPSPSTLNMTTLIAPKMQNNVVPSLIESGAIAPRASGAGVRKTYGGGGGRSFRRSKHEDESMGLPPISKEGEEDETSQESLSILSPERTLGLPMTTATMTRRSYSSMRIEYGVEEEETILLESQQASSLSSITQLIAKGESTKFTDEVTYLLEGLADTEASMTLRRSSAIELVRKLVEEREFSKRIKSSGLEEGVYKALRRCLVEGKKEGGAGHGAGDRCLEVCLAVFLGRIAREQRGFEPLMRVSRGEVGGEGSKSRRGGGEGAKDGDVLGIVRAWLEVGWSGEEIGAPVKGVGKAETRSLTSLRNLIINNDLLGSTSSSAPFPITLESLAIHLLSTIASFEPRAIFRPQLLVCTSGALKALVGTLMKGSEALEARLSKYEKGLDLLPLHEDSSTTSTTTSTRSSPHLPLLALQIGVLETCLSVCPEQALEPLTDQSNLIVTSLSTLILVSELVIFGGGGGSRHRASSTTAETETEVDPELPEQRAATASLSGALKLVLQLTIADARWSAEFVAVHQGRIVGTLVRVLQSVRKGMEEGTQRERGKGRGDEGGGGEDSEEEEARSTFDLDLLCLALGTLTNLVESVDHVKTIMRETLLSPTCQERRRCTFVCHCDGREPALAVLAKLYLETPATSNEINTSFLTGYSGLLLGLTMVDSEQNVTIVEKALEGHPRARKELQGAMDEFASLHESIEEGAVGSAEGDGNQQGEVIGGVGRRDMERSEVAVRIRDMLRRMEA